MFASDEGLEGRVPYLRYPRVAATANIAVGGLLVLAGGLFCAMHLYVGAYWVAFGLAFAVVGALALHAIGSLRVAVLFAFWVWAIICLGLNLAILVAFSITFVLAADLLFASCAVQTDCIVVAEMTLVVLQLLVVTTSVCLHLITWFRSYSPQLITAIWVRRCLRFLQNRDLHRATESSSLLSTPPATPAKPRATLPVHDDAHVEEMARRAKEQLDQKNANPVRRATTKFNEKPEAAVEYLVSANVVDGSPDSIAAFLFGNDALNPTKLGDYLSDPQLLNGQVLKVFLDLFDFKDVPLDDALRRFLAKFRLPGEAQKIDRLMEAFARRYCICCPTLFPSSDTAYVLSFSIIMLNTDAHNPSVQRKMRKSEFVSNNRGIADGKERTCCCAFAPILTLHIQDLPQAYLEGLYDNICKNEIKFSADIFSRAVKRGWLVKRGTDGGWQRRWFLVANHCLYYCRDQVETDPRAIIPLEGLSVVANSEHPGRICFEIFSPTDPKVKSVKLGPDGPVEGLHSKFVLAVEDKQELDAWIAAVQENIISSPILQLIARMRNQIARQAKATMN